VERGIIVDYLVMAGARVVMYVPQAATGAEQGVKYQPAPTGSRPAGSGSVRTFPSSTTIRIQATTVAPDGSLRLRAPSGESYNLPNATFRGEGTAQGTLISFSDGRPTSIALPRTQ
jgi:hypothetical protein